MGLLGTAPGKPAPQKRNWFRCELKDHCQKRCIDIVIGNLGNASTSLYLPALANSKHASLQSPA